MQIDVIPSFHYDVIYLEDCPTYLQRGFAILDRALEILADDSDYQFLIEQIFLVEEYCKQHPEQLAKLKRFAGEGRLHFAPGMYVMPDMNMPDGESMYLQIKTGFDWLKQNLDYRPDICWIADCWGHPAQLPQVLNSCGYKGYVFWRCMDRELQKNHFFWQGLDGSTIKSHWLRNGYSPLRFPDQSDILNAKDQQIFDASTDSIGKLAQIAETIGSGGKTLLCNGGDFMMPQNSAPAAMRQLQKNGKFVRIRFAGPAQYLAELDWGNAPVYEGEFNSAFQGTLSSNIRIKQQVRECAMLFHAAERLAALTGKEIDHRDELLKSVLKQQFHDTICGTIVDQALRDTLQELADSRRRLTKQIRGAESCPSYYFNPTQYNRTELLDHDGNYALLTVPAWQCHPAVDARALTPARKSLPAKFANHFYEAQIGDDGFITSLKVNGIELVKKDNGVKFGALTMQLDYGDLWLHFDSPLNGGSLESSLTQNRPDPLRHPEAAGLVNRSAFNPHIKYAKVEFASDELLIIKQVGEVRFWQLNVQFTVKTILRRDRAQIDYQTEIRTHGRHFRLRAVFPGTVDGTGIARYEIPFGIQARQRGTHCAQNWFDLSDDSKGLALLNRGIPANAADDDGNLMLELFRSAAMEYKGQSADSFADDVPHRFEYAIMPHAKLDFTETVKAGMLLNLPLSQTDAIPARGPIVSNRQVVISALRPCTNGILLQIYEATGKAAATEITLDQRFQTVTLADGLGNVIGAPQAIKEGNVTLQFKAFEIKTLLLQ